MLDTIVARTSVGRGGRGQNSSGEAMLACIVILVFEVSGGYAMYAVVS